MQTIATATPTSRRSLAAMRLVGLLLAASAVMHGVALAGRVPADVSLPAVGSAWRLLADLLLSAVLLVLAFRVPGAAGRRAGPVLLVAWGVLPLVGTIEAALPAAPSPLPNALGNVERFGVPIVALLASALLVRARVLPAVARWTLLVAALVQIASLAVLLSAPSLFTAVFVLLPAVALELALQLAAAIALLAARAAPGECRDAA